MRTIMVIGPHGLPVLKDIPEDISDILELQQRREMRDYPGRWRRNEWRLS